MKKHRGFEIKIFVMGLWFWAFSACAYAIDPGTLSQNTGDDRPVRSISIEESENSEDGAVQTDPTSSSLDPLAFLQSGDQALVRLPPADNSATVVNGQVVSIDGPVPEASPATPLGQPQEQASSAIVDEVLSRMVDAGMQENLSQVLTYISAKDYQGLAKFQTEHPEISNKLAEILQDISNRMATTTMSPEHQANKDYVDHWLEQVRNVQQMSSISGGRGNQFTTDLPVEAVTKLYRPIAIRISETLQSLEEAATRDRAGEKISSENLLKNFSAQARRLILDSLDQAKTNLANGILSGPLESTAFGAETPALQGPLTMSDPATLRKMTSTELYVKSREYRVVDSVYIGKSFIYAQKMLHPPANLHPYLKWLLYVRNLTPAMMEQYLATRESVEAIYAQAKAGQGYIRYKGRVYGAFLPFAETAAGNYELVKPASAE